MMRQQNTSGFDPGLIITGIAGAVVGVWLELDTIAQVMLVLMAIDYSTGVMLAVINGKLSSNAGARGIAKKAIAGMVVMAAYWMQTASLVNVPLGQAVAGFYAANELVSILENATLAGLPVPDALRRAIAALSNEPPKTAGGATG